MKTKASLRFAVFFGIALGELPAQPASQPFSDELKPGVVVESVAPNSIAQKMGVEPGNVILSWKRGERHGLIGSPFDLLDVEIEELPEGDVTLQGTAGALSKSWSWAESKTPNAPEGAWGLTTRPNLGGSLLAAYQVAVEAAKPTNLVVAVGHWEDAARQAQAQHLPHWLTSWFWLRASESLAAGKDVKGADGACRQGVEFVQADGSTAVYQVLRACGDLMLQQRAEEQEQAYYQQALGELQKSNANSLRCASILTILGRMAYTHDDYTHGEALVLQALKIQEQLAPGSMVYASNLNRIGVVMQSTGELDASKDYLLRAVAARERLIPESVPLAQTIQNLGDTLVMRGDLDQAESYHSRALKLLERLQPDTMVLAGCLVDVAGGADDRGDLVKAEEYLRRALVIQQKLRPRGAGTAASLNNLGLIVQKRGQLAATEKLFRQALSIKEELEPGSVNVAISLANLGSVLRERGDFAKSEEYLLRALEIREKFTPKSPDTATVYSELGALALERTSVAQAEGYYQKALSLYEAAAPSGYGTSDVFQALGDIAWKNKHEAAEAERYYLRSLEIRERLSQSTAQYAEILMALGEVAQSMKRLDTAEQRFRQAMDALEKQTAQFGGAEEVRAGFRARHARYYRGYISLLLEQNLPEPAFEVRERSSARTLLETLATARVDIRKGVDPDLIRRERTLQAGINAKSERRVHLLAEKQSEDQIKAVEKEISALTGEYQDVEAQIRSSSPEYAALTQPQPLSTKEIQEQLLDPDTLLIEYSLDEERSHVFVLSADSLAAYDLPKRAEIETAARRMYGLLTAPNRRISGEKPAERAARVAQAAAVYPQAAEQLSRLLLGPIAGKLAGKRLLIVSDGALHYVPFAALPVHGSGKASIPLVAHHEIINLPSASVLAVLRRERLGRQPAAKTVAVLADPVFDSSDVRVKRAAPDQPNSIGEVRSGDSETPTGAGAQEKSQAQAGLEFADEEESLALAHLTRSAADVGWQRTHRGEIYLPRLQSTRREAEAIVSAVPAGQSFEALDFEANRATATSAELANYRVLHFATHALLNNKHPELSGLVLSLVDKRGRPQSGFLGLEDIYNLNLPAELVVLSACETALGKDIEGEGMVGLTRGFMYAGASRVMASLWNIDDRATADQMKYFYRAMVGQGMRPAAALRAAQLKMRHDARWKSPYFWAAFQIQGEWR